MKKLLLSFAAFTALYTSANAQIGFAPEVGLNISSVREKVFGDKVDGIKSRPGFKIGASVDLPIVGGLSIQPGLFYSMKGGKYKDEYSVGSITTTTESKLTLSYLEVPVNVVYKFSREKQGFFVFAGPYVGYAIGGKTKVKTTTGSLSSENTEDVDFGGDKGDTKRLDVGANVGLGYMISAGGFVRAQYGHGFANLIEGGDSDNYAKNSCFAISFGFMLGGR
jgi:hypothetical protein